jgi:hypothetical protein
VDRREEQQVSSDNPEGEEPNSSTQQPLVFTLGPNTTFSAKELEETSNNTRKQQPQKVLADRRRTGMKTFKVPHQNNANDHAAKEHK